MTTAFELRQAIRAGAHTGNTSGLAAGHVQCNLMILPGDWAAEFMRFCSLNKKPCPLIAVSEREGDPMMPTLGRDIDIRSDVPAYRVFEHGELIDEPLNISKYWRKDLTTFAIGCSFSFEDALLADGLEIRNVTEQKNVPMYRTNMACTATQRLQGNMVVSMRPMVASDAIRAVQICTRFPSVHGAPVHLGDPTQIGIHDLSKPDFGDCVSVHDGEIPVFWACGVTPQVVVQASKPPFCISHGPGAMLVTDLLNSQLAIL